MIAQRNFAYFYTAKCDCCKRVRKLKTKIEVIDENGALLGEMSICPKCLSNLNFGGNKDKKAAGEIETEIVEDDFSIFDEDEMNADDYKKLGYEVQML